MAKFTGHRNSVSKEKYKRTENKIEKFKEYVRGRATEKSSAALFRYRNFLFIKKMKGIAKRSFFMIEYSTP